MQRSLTTTPTNPLLLPPLYLRLRPKPSPPPFQILLPQPNKPPPPELKLERRERSSLRAKGRSFNVEVEVGEDDDLEGCLDRFERLVARTGLLRECRRRRFHENAREKKKRKRLEAALLRRRRRLYKQKGFAKHDEKTSVEKDDEKSEFWAFSDESFEELIDDEKEELDEEIESYFQDDGEGTWRLFDGISRT